MRKKITTPLQWIWMACTLLAALIPSCAAETPESTNEFLPFQIPGESELRSSKKKVFAHYFTQFPISISNEAEKDDYYNQQYLTPEGENNKHITYGGFLRDRPLPRPVRPEENWRQLDTEEEVRRAAAIGLDGFSCDLLAYEGTHWKATIDLLEAAQRVAPDFKILLMPDMSAAFKQNPEKLTDAILALSKYPSAYRLADGRLVISPFATELQSAQWWKNWLDEMKGKGIDIAFVPLFLGWRSYAKDYAPFSYGLSDWGWRSSKANQQWRDVPTEARKYTPIWMMPVAPQDSRPYAFIYSEATNSENYRVMWENAILGDADWVQVITWNDYSEHAHIAPSMRTQWSYYDLTAYYTAWFKTGKAPTITRDAIFYFYRIQSTEAKPDLTRQNRVFAPAAGTDEPRNEIEALVF